MSNLHFLPPLPPSSSKHFCVEYATLVLRMECITSSVAFRKRGDALFLSFKEEATNLFFFPSFFGGFFFFGIPPSFHFKSEVYDKVIEDVLENMRGPFQDQGVDLGVLADFKVVRLLHFFFFRLFPSSPRPQIPPSPHDTFIFRALRTPPTLSPPPIADLHRNPCLKLFANAHTHTIAHALAHTHVNHKSITFLFVIVLSLFLC